MNDFFDKFKKIRQEIETTINSIQNLDYHECKDEDEENILNFLKDLRGNAILTEISIKNYLRDIKFKKKENEEKYLNNYWRFVNPRTNDYTVMYCKEVKRYSYDDTVIVAGAGCSYHVDKGTITSGEICDYVYTSTDYSSVEEKITKDTYEKEIKHLSELIIKGEL